MSYKNLDIWKLARELTIEIHAMSLTLPKFEMYETGSQIRRSSKGVRSAIVEGYGKRYYKADYIKYLITAQASCDETADHLDTLFETGSLTDKEKYLSLSARSTYWAVRSITLHKQSRQTTKAPNNPNHPELAEYPVSSI